MLVDQADLQARVAGRLGQSIESAMLTQSRAGSWGRSRRAMRLGRWVSPHDSAMWVHSATLRCHMEAQRHPPRVAQLYTTVRE